MSQFEGDFPRCCSKLKKKKKVCGFILRSPLWIGVERRLLPDGPRVSKIRRFGGGSTARVCLVSREALGTLFLQSILKITSVGTGLLLSCLQGKGVSMQRWRGEVERGRPGRWWRKLRFDAMGPWQVTSPLLALVPPREMGMVFPAAHPRQAAWLTVSGDFHP